MLKYFFHCALFTICYLNSTAQKKELSGGFQGGVIINSVSGAGVPETGKDHITSFGAGAHFKIQTSKYFAFKALLNYEENGWVYHNQEVNFGNVTAHGDRYAKLKYLNMPLLVECGFGNTIKLYVDGGFFAGLLLSDRVIDKTDFAPNPIESYKDNDRKKFNFGASVGAGLQIPITSTIKIDIHARNNFGLINVNTSSNSSKGSYHTNALAIVAGVSFTLRAAKSYFLSL